MSEGVSNSPESAAEVLTGATAELVKIIESRGKLGVTSFTSFRYTDKAEIGLKKASESEEKAGVAYTILFPSNGMPATEGDFWSVRINIRRDGKVIGQLERTRMNRVLEAEGYFEGATILEGDPVELDDNQVRVVLERLEASTEEVKPSDSNLFLSPRDRKEIALSILEPVEME